MLGYDDLLRDILESRMEGKPIRDRKTTYYEWHGKKREQTKQANKKIRSDQSNWVTYDTTYLLMFYKLKVSPDEQLGSEVKTSALIFVVK